MNSTGTETLAAGSSRRSSLAAYWFAAALVSLTGVLHIALARGIYADGAWFLLHVLQERSFWFFNYARAGAQIVYELPLVAAVAAGADNVKFLARVFTFGLVVPVVLLYLGALWKVRTNAVLFGAFVLIVVAVHQNLNLMAIGEYNLLYALVTFSLAILIQDREPAVVDALLLAACALAAARTYEALVFLGPMLVAACVLRLRVSKPTGLVRIALGLATLLLVVGSVLAALGILMPRSPGNLHGAIRGLTRFNPQMVLSCVLAAAYAGYVLLRPRAVRLAMIAVFVMALLALAVPAAWSHPKLHYLSRAPGGIILFAIGVVLISVRFSRLCERVAAIRNSAFARIVLIAPLLALTVASAPDVYHSLGWKRFLDSVERAANARTGLVPYRDAMRILKSEKKYGWIWSYPTMSILVRHGPSHAIILNPNPSRGWQPFNPEDKDSIPKIGDEYTWR